MSDSPFAIPTSRTPETPAFVAWLGAAAVGFGSGFAAVYIQESFAPIGVFPLALGAITGLAVGGVWSARGGGARRAVLRSALLAGVICITTLHYGSYFASRRADAARRANVPAAAAFVEPNLINQENPALRTFPDFMKREWRRGRGLGSYHVQGIGLGLWWLLDGLAIVGAAMVAANVAAKSTMLQSESTTNELDRDTQSEAAQ